MSFQISLPWHRLDRDSDSPHRGWASKASRWNSSKHCKWSHHNRQSNHQHQVLLQVWDAKREKKTRKVYDQERSERRRVSKGKDLIHGKCMKKSAHVELTKISFRFIAKHFVHKAKVPPTLLQAFMWQNCKQ